MKQHAAFALLVLSISCTTTRAVKKTRSVEKQVLQNRPVVGYCSGFRLGEYPELVDEVVAEALRSSTWDRQGGKVKNDKWGGQNNFVFKSLQKSKVFSAMMAKCPPGTTLLTVEKVFVSRLDKIDAMAESKVLGQPGDKVPHDGIIVIQQ